jgi:hypothetical protein
MAMLMVSLDAMTDILAAYPVRDLQHFNHILQRFEAIGADLPTTRMVIQKRIDAELSRLARVSRAPARVAKHGLCPHCLSPMDPVITGDGSAVIGCRKCRYSALVEA